VGEEMRGGWWTRKTIGRGVIEDREEVRRHEEQGRDGRRE